MFPGGDGESEEGEAGEASEPNLGYGVGIKDREEPLFQYSVKNKVQLTCSVVFTTLKNKSPSESVFTFVSSIYTSFYVRKEF